MCRKWLVLAFILGLMTTMAQAETFSLGAYGDITIDNGPRAGQDGNRNTSGLEARDIPDRRHVFLISYNISGLSSPVSNVSLSHFSHDVHDETNVYGIIEDLDLLDVESLTWTTAPGVQNDPLPELNSPVALDMNDLTEVLMSFVGPNETGVRFSTDTSDALADFINSDTDGILTLLFAPAAEGNNLIVRSREHSAGGTLLEGDAPVPPMVAYWPMDEGEGTLVADVVGGNDGTMVGLDPNTAWIADGGVAFDNVDGHHIEVPHADAIEFGDESLTISLMVRYTNPPQGDADLWVQKGTSFYPAGTGCRYQFFQTGGPEVRFTLDDNVTKTDLKVPNDAFLTGEWVHVVAIRDAANDLMSVYADGILLGTQTDNTGDISNGEPLWIGEFPDGTDSAMSGDIKDVRIYNAALTEDEIASISPAPTAAMVVNDADLSAGFDQVQHDRLAAMGYKVIVVPSGDVGSAFTIDDADKCDLLLVSESIGSSAADPLIGTTTPAMHNESYGWDNWLLTTRTQSTWVSVTDVDIVDDTLGAAVGPMTFYTVETGATSELVSALAPGALNIAQVTVDANDFTLVFLVDEGAELVDGSAAPSRIAGFSLPGQAPLAADVMTDDAWALWDATIAWLKE